jgi:hypothetical protein
MTEPPERPTTVSFLARLGEPDALPSERKFLQWIRDGRTFREIEVECAARAGISLGALSHIERSLLTMKVDHAITNAMTSKGLDHRYFAAAPWRVLDIHRHAHELRMLHLLGRRRCGQPLGPSSASALDSFLLLLDRARLIVAYCPALEEGFAYVPDSWRAGPDADVPVCVPILPLVEIEWIRERGL